MIIFHNIIQNVQTETNEVGHIGLQTTVQLISTYVQLKRSTQLVGLHLGTSRHPLRQTYFLSQNYTYLRVPHNAAENVLQNKNIPSQYPLCYG